MTGPRTDVVTAVPGPLALRNFGGRSHERTLLLLRGALDELVELHAHREQPRSQTHSSRASPAGHVLCGLSERDPARLVGGNTLTDVVLALPPDPP